MLNRRCLNIINHLIENGNLINIKELAESYRISERSIRYDIENINYFFNRNNLNTLVKKTKGVYEIDESKENLSDILNLLNVQFYSFSKNERIRYLKTVCLFSNYVIRLHEISETLSVSLSTIKIDLKEVKKYLSEKELKLKFYPKLGLALEGGEEKRRKLQLKYMLDYLVVRNEKLDVKNVDNETLGHKIICKELMDRFDDINLSDIRIFIKRIERHLDTLISDEAFKVLELYLLIAVNRLQNGFEIEERDENANFLLKTKEYKVLVSELEHLENNFSIEFTAAEILLLTELFLGSHSYNFSTSFYENWIEIEVSVNEMIKKVGDNLGVDLSKDKILLNGLLNHMKPAIYRIKNEIVLENAISEEAKLVYEDLFYSVKDIAKRYFEPYVNKEIPDEEIAFLTIHFKIAMDRKVNTTRKTKNVILISGFGYGSSKLLSQKLLDNFDVNIVEVLPYHKFVEIEPNEEIDLIITTIEINPKIAYSSPIIKVNPILSKKDRIKLKELGLAETKKKVALSKLVDTISNENNIKNTDKLAETLIGLLGPKIFDDRENLNKKKLADLISIDRIKLDSDVDNWQDAIKLAGQVLECHGSVTNEYTNEMIETVNKNGSYMIVADKIVLPHARHSDSVIKTDMALIRLKKEVTFPDNKKIRILFPFSSVNQNEHIEALSQLISLVDEYDFINVIESINTSQELKKFLEKYREI